MSENRQIVTIADCQWQGQLPFQQGDSHNVDGASPFWRSRIGIYEAREYPLTPLFHYVMIGFTWATLLAERIAGDGDALIDAVEFALCLDQFQDDFTVDYNEEQWKHFEVHWPLPSEPVMVFGEWRSCAMAGAKVFLTVIWASACNSGDFEFATDPDCQVWPDPKERVLDWQAGFRSRLAKFTAQWPGEALGGEYNRVATLMKKEYRQYQRREATAERELRDTKPGEVMTGEERAMAILTVHPDWTDKRIAREAGLHEKTLYKYHRYKTARGILKDSGYAGLPRGFKTENGDIEAYE